MRLYPLIFLLMAIVLVVRTYWHQAEKIVSGARRAAQKSALRHELKRKAKNAQAAENKKKAQPGNDGKGRIGGRRKRNCLPTHG
jgi:hypothetical protein